MPETQAPRRSEIKAPTRAGSAGDVARRELPAKRIARLLSFRNISAIYIFVVMFVVFSIWVPDTFLRWDTWRALFDSQAVTAILAVGLVIALSAGAFNLAIGAELGFGAILSAWLLVHAGMGVVPAIGLTLVAGALIGLVSGLLIIKVKIPSFIATLGVSSILLALIAWTANSQQILGLPGGFQDIGTVEILGLTLPVYLMLFVSLLVWYVLEWTPLGRRVYAAGGNIEAARLAGVPVGAVVVGALVACGVIAAFAGLVVSAKIGAGDPTIGPAYLLPAFSAAFLGSTQFRGGRFNVWGTVVAVYVLATGVKGLQLAGGPVWIPDLFNGVALLLAVGLANFEATAARAGAVRKLLRIDQRSARRSDAASVQS
jgi:ribose transport system permease protein